MLLLSLQENKLICDAATEEQMENCQHRWLVEEEKMTKSVRFNNTRKTAVLITSLPPCLDMVGKVKRAVVDI